MLIVVGSAWFIYQMNHSRHEVDNFGDLEQKILVSLGRKGSPLWFQEIQFPTLGNVHIGDAKRDENSYNADGSGGAKEVDVQRRMNTEADESIEENEDVEELETLDSGVLVHTFHDENGVPPGVNETEIVYGEAEIEIVHEEIISNDSKEDEAFKGNTIEVLTSENEIELLDLSTSVVVDAESQSIIAHADI